MGGNMADKTDRTYALSLLRKSLEVPDAEFRPGQWEVIDRLVNMQKRILCVQRTGWGKSWVYFLATRLLRDKGRGPTLIISPLLALMRNQIDAAHRLGITAMSINSTNRSEWPVLTQTILEDQADTLLISPERLANDDFVNEVLLPVSKRVGLLVIDEAHCISDWGHDFRPDYRRLIHILQYLPSNMPVLGTTATANNRVLNDLQEQLGSFEIQRGALTRETIHLQTLCLSDQAARLAWLAEHVPKLPGTGIIYTLTKKDAERVTQWLVKNNIKAETYHSSVTSESFETTADYRGFLEDQLLKNRIKALVATVALGMGYDKPDLGFVIHFQAPESIISYYQQVGRAGRSIDRSFGVLLMGKEDHLVHRFFRENSFPTEQEVSLILEALEDTDGLNIRGIEQKANIGYGAIDKALKYLSVEDPAPVFLKDRLWFRTPSNYRLDHERIGRLTNLRETEWKDVLEYINHKGCQMQFLAAKLDDPATSPCGKCSNCTKSPVVSEHCPSLLVEEALRFLKLSEFELPPKKQVAQGAFPTYGFKGNLKKDLLPETGRILCRLGDIAWGHMALEDMQAKLFRDELVDAMVDMVSKRWVMDPAPTWVTCVPSLRNPRLVPDFARKVAKGLGLPFIEAVTKVLNNEPQSLQHNRFHKCHNLDGAFEVSNVKRGAPVLLIDDLAHSGWTITVVSLLLRQQGSGPVWPAVLTTNNNAV